MTELLQVAKALRDWIDAVPKDVVLPTMPGVDRDWVDGVIKKTEKLPINEKPAFRVGTNSGHGHVWERPDGMKVCCGGWGICVMCGQDAAHAAWVAKEQS